MNTNDVMTAISTLGFPIVMCGFFAWYTVQRDKKEAETEERHKEELNVLAEAIQNNTVVMQQIVDKLEVK